MDPLAQLDQQFVWHPFTQMRDWMRGEPVVIVSGRGAVLRDVQGRKFLDANASIWTNLHGHRNPTLTSALRRQLGRIAHSSFLGLTNEPAACLARELVRVANPSAPETAPPPPFLARVFYSDNGSTALEVALKLAWEVTRRERRGRVPRFVSLQGAYHGDTIGAVSLGHIDQFHAAYRGLLFRTDAVMAPYCYRCPYNRARPERADARTYRSCRWECVTVVERAFARARRRGRPYSAFVYEPRMQGAAGMIPQPDGWLTQTAKIARDHKALLIADEVMTGFGRTGVSGAGPPPLFASHHENVRPDFLVLAKGLSGGYLPFAATLTTSAVFDAFLGEHAEHRTFYHGHSFSGNALGATAALTSLAMLEDPACVRRRAQLERAFTRDLASLWRHPAVGDVRQVGLVAGIELVRDWTIRAPFDARDRIGFRVCEAMKRRGVLTRPIGDVIVLMPPYCTTRAQLRRMISVLGESIEEVTELNPISSPATKTALGG